MLNENNDGPAPSLETGFPASFHVYGRSAVLCATSTETRRRDLTISLEFAKADGTGAYDWPGKVQFQLSPGELAQLAALLSYPGSSLHFVHTSSSTKKLLVDHQADGSALFTLISRIGTVRVPVSPADQFFLRNLLIARLSVAQRLPPAFILASLRTLAAQIPADSG